ncbi:MAG: N-acetylmuramoyl-L-alanine amidase, partial [Firmicutes bacterium]|nr:N-acetylmuramoyl-L-alanine amidase [Bacillota bacterium]
MINDDIRCNTNNYQKGRNSKIKYIVVHYTASPNDTAEGEATYFKNTYVGASAHYFVDGDSVYRSVNDKDTAWHCGANKYFHNECRNDNSIGVEMCCKKKNPTSRNAEDKDWYFDEGTLK